MQLKVKTKLKQYDEEIKKSIKSLCKRILMKYWDNEDSSLLEIIDSIDMEKLIKISIVENICYKNLDIISYEYINKIKDEIKDLKVIVDHNEKYDKNYRYFIIDIHEELKINVKERRMIKMTYGSERFYDLLSDYGIEEVNGVMFDEEGKEWNLIELEELFGEMIL